MSYRLKVSGLDAVAMTTASSVDMIHIEACGNWPYPDFMSDDMDGPMTTINGDLAVPF